MKTLNEFFLNYWQSPGWKSQKPCGPGNLNLVRLMVTALLTLLMLYGGKSNSQSLPEEWQYITEVNEIRFYYRFSDCPDLPLFFIRIENTGSETVYCAWSLEAIETSRRFLFTGTPGNLEPGEVIEGTCENPNPELAFRYPEPGPARSLNLTAEVKR